MPILARLTLWHDPAASADLLDALDGDKEIAGVGGSGQQS